MSRYIDADKYLDELDKQICSDCIDEDLHCCSCGVGCARAIAKDAPTADVVEVVRCKYCKYYNENKFTYSGDGYGRCDHPRQAYDDECYDMWVETTPDDYCSYGERSENGK